MIWFIIFSLSAFFTLFSGNKLAKHGDIIGEKTKLGGLWVGSFILAFITSLPELSTAIFSQIIKAPDLVFGDIFGSNMFNLAILDIVF
jgi:cation:H+ antiporter